LGKYSDSCQLFFTFPSLKDSGCFEEDFAAITAAETVLDSHQIPY
jgi:hypothetical protein